MGQPIPFHPHPQATNGALHAEHLGRAPAEHAEALLAAYELLQLLHDKGVLNLLRGVVASGDDLIGTIAVAMDKPESIHAIRNFILLSKFFGSLPPDVLSSLVETARVGARREKAHRAPGMLQLLWRLRNEDSRHALAVALDLIEGLGKGL
jgi:uncharacterized protein YjgD (DUF1641 family)